MELQEIAGYTFILVGLADLILGKTLVIPRVPEQSRKVFEFAFTLGAVTCWVIGAALLMKWIRL